jgi:hypothetical protein
MQSVHFLVAINDRVRHVPTDRSGRVTGLLAGLEGRRLVNIQYTDETGAIRSHWSLQSEVEPIKPMRRPAPRARTWPSRAPAVTQVSGEAYLVDCEESGIRFRVAAVFVPHDGTPDFKVLTNAQFCERVTGESWGTCDDRSKAVALANDTLLFIDSGASARTFSVETARFHLVSLGPVSGAGSAAIVRNLFEAHVK